MRLDHSFTVPVTRPALLRRSTMMQVTASLQASAPVPAPVRRRRATAKGGAAD